MFISPHLDDAVFSCGRCLAAHPGCTVISIFAGRPQARHCLTEWDARSGFADAHEAMTLRRDEDRRALASLGASPLWLDFFDSQYAEPEAVERIARGLVEVLTRLAPDDLLLPLGLFHSDHLLAHEAAALALRKLPPVRVIAYEDVPYRAMEGLLQRRLSVLAAEGVCATPVDLSGDAPLAAKQMAVAAYASQLRAFGDGGPPDLWRPERFWRLGGGAFAGTPFAGCQGVPKGAPR